MVHIFNRKCENNCTKVIKKCKKRKKCAFFAVGIKKICIFAKNMNPSSLTMKRPLSPHLYQEFSLTYCNLKFKISVQRYFISLFLAIRQNWLLTLKLYNRYNTAGDRLPYMHLSRNSYHRHKSVRVALIPNKNAF